MNCSIKKMFSLLLSIIMISSILQLLPILPSSLIYSNNAEAATILDSGNFGTGNSLTWTFDSDGVLTISGSGNMSGSPWRSSHKTSIKSVVITNGVTSISDSAFYGCTELTGITIPNSVSSIGTYAFYDCKKLASIALPDPISSIEKWAFANCEALTSITMPNSLSSISERTFSGCNKLTSITIPNSVSSIGKYAFSTCKALTSVNISSSLSSIGEFAFSTCETLTSITIPNSVSSIGKNAFEYCKALTSITIPSSVSSIEDGTFQNCTALTSITIPGSVSSVKSGAFQNCSALTSITIPDSVSSVGGGAFQNCTALKEATILSKTVTFASNNTFTNSSGDFVIKGYSGSTAETYADNNSHTFVDIEETASTPAPDTESSNPASTSSPSAGGITNSIILNKSHRSHNGSFTFYCSSIVEFIGDKMIEVVVPTDGTITDFVLDPTKLLAKALADSEINVDPNASLLFNNRDTDGNIVGMSGRSDPVRFINKGRMPVNAVLTIKPEADFSQSVSTLNLVKSRSDFNGKQANVYLAANVPEWEDVSIGTPDTGAVINALIPDSRYNFSPVLNTYISGFTFEYKVIDSDDNDVWNGLDLYFTGEADTFYPKWTDPLSVVPSKVAKAKYTTLWALSTVTESENILDTTNNGIARDVTLPLTGAVVSNNPNVKSTEKIYIKPINRFTDLSEPESYNVSDVTLFLTIKKDKIVLNDNFAKYCKEKWGAGKVLIYAPGTQGVIAVIK